jgi:hypothetical protein
MLIARNLEIYKKPNDCDSANLCKQVSKFEGV